MSIIKKIILGTVSIIILIVVFMVVQEINAEKNIEQNNKKIISELKIDNVDLLKISDGKYTGAYDAGIANVKVAVTVKDKKIVDVILVNTKGKPAKAIPGKVVKAQSLQVDTVSGATVSSKVILKSIENALISGKV